MSAKLILKLIFLLVAYFFPKSKIAFGSIFMALMHLFGAFFILVAYADYGIEPNSVVQFEIILGLTFVLIGWVLGVFLEELQKDQEMKQMCLLPTHQRLLILKS